MLSSSMDSTIKLWSLRKQTLINTIEPTKTSLSPKPYPITNVIFNPYDKQFICSGYSKTVQLYDFENMSPSCESRMFHTPATHLQFENNGDFVIAAGKDYMYCLDNNNMRTVASYDVHWKSLDKLITAVIGGLDYLFGFEIKDDAVSMYSCNYFDLFPFRIEIDEMQIGGQIIEETNYVVEKPKVEPK